MGSKKGQVSYFILLGVFALIIALVFLYIHNSGSDLEGEVEVPFEIQPVKAFVGACIESSLERGLHLSALRGGKMFDKEYVFETGNDIFSYYIYYDSLVFPSTDEIRKDLLQFFKIDIENCAKKIKLSKGQSVEFGEYQGVLELGSDGSKLFVDWDLRITIGEKLFTLNKFFATSDIRYTKVFVMAKQIALAQLNEPNVYFPLTPDPLISTQVFPYDDDLVIYTLTDRSSSPHLIFSFAVLETVNAVPHLDPIPDFTLTIGEPFSYNLSADDADGDVLSFTTDSENIRIGSEGEISFIPSFTGKFSVTITVTDEFGAIDEQDVGFRIDPPSGDDRIMTNGFVELTIPIMEDFRYEYPAFSTAGEKLNCAINIPTFRFEDGCTLVIDANKNMVVDDLARIVTITDESGFETLSTLILHMEETPTFYFKPMSTMYATKGERFSYQTEVVRLEQEPFRSLPLIYSDNSEMFSIKQNGMIEFIPSTEGRQTITIYARDRLNNTQEETFEMVINE